MSNARQKRPRDSSVCGDVEGLVMDCTQNDWNPLPSASSISALAGVLAGLVFAGLVVLLVDRTPSRERMRAVVLLSAALLALAIDGFLFALIAGEQICTRAWTAMVPAAGLMGVGVLGIFGGVSALVNAYDDWDGRATRMANVSTYVIALLVTYYLHTTTTSYMFNLRKAGMQPLPTSMRLVFISWVWVALAIMLALPFVRSLLRTRLFHRAGVGSQAEADIDPQPADRLASASAYLSTVYVVIVAVLYGLVIRSTRSDWEGPSSGVVVSPTVPGVVALFSLIIPTLALAAQLLALPISPRLRVDNQATSVDPSQVRALDPPRS